MNGSGIHNAASADRTELVNADGKAMSATEEKCLEDLQIYDETNTIDDDLVVERIVNYTTSDSRIKYLVRKYGYGHGGELREQP